MVWYSHLYMNFPQFVVIHTVKGFKGVSEAEVDIFLECPCFLHDPMNVDNLISHASAFYTGCKDIYIYIFFTECSAQSTPLQEKGSRSGFISWAVD